VLSRCLQFNLKEMPDQLLRPYLAKLLDSEKVSYEELAVAHVAQAADGSVRDALSLLDQAIAYGQGEVKSAEVEAMLGRFSPSRLYDVLDAVAADEPAQLFRQVEELAAYVPDYSYVLGELLVLLHQVATIQTVGSLQQGNVHDEKRLQDFATRISPQDVQLWYQIGLTGRRDMPYAPNQRQALEMTLIRMLAFKPFAANSAAPQQKVGGSDAGNGATNSRPVQTSPAKISQTPTPVKQPANDVAVAPKPDAPPTPRSVAAKPPVNPEVVKDATQPEPAAEDEEPQLPPADLNWKPADWTKIVIKIPVSGPPLQLARNCILQKASKDEVHLLLDPEYETLAAPRWKERLRQKMSVLAEGEVKLKVSIPAERPEGTPAMLEKKAEDDKLEEARSSIADDPLVAEIVEKFGAEVSTVSVKSSGEGEQKDS